MTEDKIYIEKAGNMTKDGAKAIRDVCNIEEDIIEETLKTKEELENGCGIWNSYSPSSKCVKGNLCSECRNSLDYYSLGKKESKKGMIKIKDVMKIIDKNKLIMPNVTYKKIKQLIKVLGDKNENK